MPDMRPTLITRARKTATSWKTLTIIDARANFRARLVRRAADPEPVIYLDK